MGRPRRFLRRLLGRRPSHTDAEVEELRLEFKSRYLSFRLLLDANQKALEQMALLDASLDGTRPISMTWVRGVSTRIGAQVYKMVLHLLELAPGKYDALRDRFRAIQAGIEAALAPVEPPREGALVLGLDEIDSGSADLVGGKLANLGEIRNRVGLRVPDGFAVTTTGFARMMEAGDLRSEIERRLQVASAEGLDELHRVSHEIQDLIARTEVPPDLAEEILAGYRALRGARGGDLRLAVRSSALGEDAVGASFAGQYLTELNVGEDSLLAAYASVVASQYGVPAMTYRHRLGIRESDTAMCAGFLEMVDAVAGGVAYSRNPVDERDDSVQVHSAFGLGKPVVDGRVAADLFVVDRGDPPEIRRREIPVKERKFVTGPDEGVRRVDLSPEEGAAPSLPDEAVVELARIALRLEEHYGAPQDIEWALDGRGGILVLQTRPLLRLTAARGEPTRPPADDLLIEGGATASPGAAAGPAFVAARDADALRFPEGAVLVVEQALPRWAPLLSRAAGVVSERGSVAGHLASVARELGVPALFGLAGATARLADAGVVTLDADGRRVHPGRVEEVLRRAPAAPALLEGSPVLETVRAVHRHISPLGLLDPDSPDFSPERCRTLHDITRFSHEKAIAEMFRFGKDHDFPERSGKQLHCDVPMQWWVLNLDDGFAEEVSGKYVRLENIVSIPMRALWEGIVAVPWEGPPPLDGKGFLSVMFQATTNPELTSEVRSKYADRNYFLVSRHYCSLSSRLGAHFAIVEAMVSDRTRENYVTFQFKGGAADFDRRLRRIQFVREILEERGFRVETNEDNLIGRVENREAPYMLSRLRILGYLSIHTRQLDMVMSRPALVARYAEKMRADLLAVARD